VNTGDVAMIFPNGSVKIFDRAKNIFKLAQGEYIAPEKLENIYVQCPSVMQIFVHGDSHQHYILAIIHPNWENVKPWAHKKGLNTEDLKGLCENPELKKQILDEINAKAREF
jgi:long-chain acyl-CoA synthetase